VKDAFLNEREGGTMTPDDIDWLLVYPLVKMRVEQALRRAKTRQNAPCNKAAT
jgi:hypothetical protein